ncbi:MAG: 30S ribosomal protein S24e [Archaeoglobaceae archaeon]
MEVYVESDRYNPLLKRREIRCRIEFEGSTPRREDVRQKVAGLFNAEPDRVVVDYIKTEFGKTEARCYVKIYDTREDLLAIEEEHIIRRNFGGGEGGEGS